MAPLLGTQARSKAIRPYPSSALAAIRNNLYYYTDIALFNRRQFKRLVRAIFSISTAPGFVAPEMAKV